MKKIRRVRGKLVLGAGEQTGHDHTIRERSAQLFDIGDGRMLLKLPKASLLRHERGDTPAEHRDIELPSGEPVVSHKRQYTPDGWETVQD